MLKWFKRSKITFNDESNFRIVASADVKAISDQDGGVLLHTRKGVYYSLNPQGMKIWSFLQKEATFGEILKRLQNEYEATTAQLRDDLTTFFRFLNERSLLNVRK